MSRDPEQILREGLAAWNRGDVEGISQMLDPDVRIHLSGAFPALDTEYRGREGLRVFWREMHDMWDELAMEAGDTEEVEGMLLSPITFKGKGRDGIEVEREFWFVWDFDPETGLVVSYSSNRDREMALDWIKRVRAKGGSA